MGYGYTQNGTLCCDKCGESGGVRKRTCPHKVGDLPYCPAPALCAKCWEELGKNKIHDRCKPMAELRRKEEAHRETMLNAGYYERRTAWGEWHEAVPAGMVGVCFVGREGEHYRLLTEADYHKYDWLHEFGDMAQPWPNHPGATTKQCSAS